MQNKKSRQSIYSLLLFSPRHPKKYIQNKNGKKNDI